MCEHDYQIIKCDGAVLVKMCMKCGDKISEDMKPKKKGLMAWLKAF